ncbi:MAG: response regulator [Cyanobacteria bacterium REEB67]|nr:response regulator [Cyanobacteria bacterium REEB67]
MQKKAIKVLLIEDNAFDADILSELLEESSVQDLSLTWVDRLSRARQAVQAETFDLILMDMNLPDSDGLETLFRAQKISPDLPIIVLSGHSDEAIAIEAVQNGAQDYLVKGQFTSDILVRCILYAIERKLMAKQMEKQFQQLQETEQRLSAVLGGMSEGVCNVDLQGSIIYMNAAAQDILGLNIDEVMGKNFHDLVHPGEVKTCANCDLLRSRAEAGNRGRVEDEFHTKSLKILPVEFSFTALKINDHTTGSVICFRDISEQKIVEKRVKEFYSSVSHELRTPLTSIFGSLSLLENGVIGQVDRDGLELVEVARVSCDRLLRLISDLLDIKKIEAGQLELKEEEIEPTHLIDICVEAMAGYAVQSQVELVVADDMIARDVGVIKGDRDRLLQVLLNLVSNAVKFSKEGDKVTLRLEKGQAHPIRFSVCDTGPGIANHDMDKLFQRFQQLDSSDARNFGGTGLGLAISKALVEQHGGTIGVHSKVGTGSTFWFELPIAEEDLEQTLN